MIIQLELFGEASVFLCTRTQAEVMKLIRVGEITRAALLYQVELLKCLHEANGNLDDANVKQAARFGRRVLGGRVESIFAECSDVLANEVLSPVP